MKRTRKCPSSLPKEPKIESVNTYGRTTKSKVRFYFCAILIGLAILWNNRKLSPSPKQDLLLTRNLKQTILKWIEHKKNSSYINSPTLFEDDDSEKEIVRLFDNCQTDQVLLDHAEDVHHLGHLRGHHRVVFTADSWCLKNLNIANVEGLWTGRGLEGVATLTHTDGRRTTGAFHLGAMWGEMRTFRCVFGACNVWEEQEGLNVTEADHLESVLHYIGGRPDPSNTGLWFPIGGGLIRCPPDEDGLASGEGCVYLYPDLSTALLGQWQSGRMVSAHEATVTGIYDDHRDLRIVVEKTKGREEDVFNLDTSTSTKISSQPRLEDPYERKTAYVAESMIPGAGEGLFLRRDARSGDLVAVYNGVRMSEQESKLRREDRRSVYRIHGQAGDILNIPTWAQSLHNYTASLGHKVNHDKKANAEFRFLDHPRFGEVIGVFMIKPRVAGEEVLVDYGYVEKALATEAGLDMLLKAAQSVSGLSDTREFKSEMKRAIGYIRGHVDHIKPLINTLKMARSFML